MKIEQRSCGLRKIAVVAVAASLLAIATTAMADETVTVVRAPSEGAAGLYNALELGIGIGYSQGTGDVGAGVPCLCDSAGPGAALELSVGWRINPHFLVGAYGTGSWFTTGDNAANARNNWSTTAGVQGNYHILPNKSFDPWIGVGTGWRGYWVNRPEGRDSRHGLDLGRLQVGVDVPVASGVAISPFVGATATLFLTQQLADESSFSNISSPNVNMFFTAGVMGRFDVFGSAR
jgi:hypothetical protein